MNRYLALRRASHASSVAIAVLLLANAVPLIGVAFLGWDLATLVAVYWAENGVVGIYAIGRILTAGRIIPRLEPEAIPQPPPPPSTSRINLTMSGLPALGLVPFICVHYGMFWLVHGIFVWTVLPMLFSRGDSTTEFPDASVVVTAAIVLFLSHGVSFVANWLLGGEHLTSTPQAEMNAPYSRVIVLHLTILFGAFAVALLGASIGPMLVMVGLKTVVDLNAHLAERRRAEARAQAVAPLPPGLDAPAA